MRNENSSKQILRSFNENYEGETAVFNQVHSPGLSDRLKNILRWHNI